MLGFYSKLIYCKMKNLLEKISQTVSYLHTRGFSEANVGVVLGTGLECFIDLLNVEQVIDYRDIPNFPLATVEFHKGRLIMGKIGNKKVLAMQGRFHYYEGYSMQEITFPIRVLKQLGIEYLLLSNAAGGMNNNLKKGDLVVITDHINLLPENPLRGLNDPAFGNRFVDMSQPYDRKIRNRIIERGSQLNIEVKTGVYVAVEGPSLETRSEYKYMRNIGADLVGMSTVPEVIVANHIGLPCAAISVITDECDPDNLNPVNIAEIIAIAGEADITLSKLFESVILKD